MAPVEASGRTQFLDGKIVNEEAAENEKDFDPKAAIRQDGKVRRKRERVVTVSQDDHQDCDASKAIKAWNAARDCPIIVGIPLIKIEDH